MYQPIWQERRVTLGEKQITLIFAAGCIMGFAHFIYLHAWCTKFWCQDLIWLGKRLTPTQGYSTNSGRYMYISIYSIHLSTNLSIYLPIQLSIYLSSFHLSIYFLYLWWTVPCHAGCPGFIYLSINGWNDARTAPRTFVALLSFNQSI